MLLTIFGYAGAVAAMIGLVYLEKPVRRRLGPPPVDSPPQDRYQVAYLAGGASRVALVAVLALLGSGRLRMWYTRSRGFRREWLRLSTPDLPPPGDPVQRRVLDAVAGNGEISLRGLGRAVRHSTELWSIRSDLLDRGLLLTPAARVRLGAVLAAVSAPLVAVSLAVPQFRHFWPLFCVPVLLAVAARESAAGLAEVERLRAADRNRRHDPAPAGAALVDPTAVPPVALDPPAVDPVAHTAVVAGQVSTDLDRVALNGLRAVADPALRDSLEYSSRQRSYFRRFTPVA